MRRLVAALGLAFLFTGVTAVYGAQNSNQNTQRLEQQAEASRRAVCALINGSIERDHREHIETSPLVVQFGLDYHCTPRIPPL